MQPFRSLSNCPVEFREDGGRPSLSGYAAVFDTESHDLGGYREVIKHGAFDATLKDINSGKRSISARVQHEGGLTTIGNTANGTLLLNADTRGLKYHIFPPDTSAGRDIVELVKGGYINKSSFAFSLRKGGESWDLKQNPPLRELRAVDLHDVAPVDGPAYEETSVQARSLTLQNMQEFSRAQQVESRAGSGVEVRAKDGGGSVVELYFLDQIAPKWVSNYMPGVMGAGNVIDALKDVPDAERIDVYINSPGGDVFEAMSIYNTLKQHKAPVNVYVQGLAASAAGIIAMAGDSIQMGAGSFLMVHNAWTIAQGNASELRDAATLLDKIDGEIAGILAARSKNEAKQVQKWMREETWFTADEALASGFADRVSGAEAQVSEETREWCNRNGYRNTPRELGGPGGIETRHNVTLADRKAAIDAKLRAAL